MANRRKAVQATQKPTRIPMGRRNVLKVYGIQDDEEYHYRFFNDVGDRLFQCLEAGYEFVPKDGLQVGDQSVDSARGTESVVKKGVGMGTVAYLMRIPRDLYNEDQAAKQALVDQSEEGIRRPKVEGAYGKVELGQKDKPY